MDSHKPKPWHGVREFLKEYLIIVIGVLTALGAEQSVEWLHRHSELAETRGVLKQELANDVDLDAYVVQEDRCLLARLDDYLAWTTRGPKPSMDGTGLVFPKADVWEMAKAGQVFGHMPLKERLTLASLYGGVENQTQVVMILRQEYNKLSRYDGKSALTGDEARRLVEDVSEMRKMLRICQFNSEQMIQDGKAFGVAPGPLSAAHRQRLAADCRLTKAP